MSVIGKNEKKRKGVPSLCRWGGGDGPRNFGLEEAEHAVDLQSPLGSRFRGEEG
jgi:hypothetical protein